MAQAPTGLRDAGRRLVPREPVDDEQQAHQYPTETQGKHPEAGPVRVRMDGIGRPCRLQAVPSEARHENAPGCEGGYDKPG